MNEFEGMIKECLKDEFKDRVENYYYFDAKDYIKPDCIELELELHNELKHNNDELHKLKKYCESETQHNKEKGVNFNLSLATDIIKSNIEYTLKFYDEYLKKKNEITKEDIDNVEKFYKFYKSVRNKTFKEYICYSYIQSQSNKNKLIEYYDSKLGSGFKYDYVRRLVLLFVFKNIESLYKLRFIELKYSGLFPSFTDEEIIKKYLDDRLEKYKGYSDCNCDESKYIFYIKDKVTINLIDSVAKFLKLNLDTSSYYYRGHSKVKYKLIPSAFRDGGIDEKEEIDNVCAEYPELLNRMSRVDILTQIQHYGGKTRLLDITENPLVAMYFASYENLEEIGEIIVFEKDKDKECGRDSDRVAMLSSLSFLGLDKLKGIIKSFISRIKLVKQLEHLIRQERVGFKLVKSLEDLNKCVYYKANKVNERIIRQSGHFILCVIDIDKTEETLNDFRKKDDNSNVKSIYLICNKKKIIGDLKGLGINYHYLFPEIENYFKHKD